MDKYLIDVVDTLTICSYYKLNTIRFYEEYCLLSGIAFISLSDDKKLGIIFPARECLDSEHFSQWLNQQ